MVRRACAGPVSAVPTLLCPLLTLLFAGWLLGSCPASQVLECESVSHLTATSNLCFTSGKHCWQFVVIVPCDLVWLGLSDGSLTPDVWGGKQPGGWFYGSNDVSLSGLGGVHSLRRAENRLGRPFATLHTSWPCRTL